MTTAMQTTTARRGPMNSLRKTALVAVVLYLVTFIRSIPPVFLLDPVLSSPTCIHPGYTPELHP
jgi:hypothetical protein